MEVTDVQYKESEIGVIPVDWNVKKISDFSKPVRGGSPRPAGSPLYFNGDYIPWLTVAALTNISSSQIFVSETEGFLTQLGSEYSRTLEKDTLIIANSGATLGVAKLLAIKCCANDGIAALNNFSREVDKAYVVYYINSITQKLREVVATGNGQPNLNTTLIGDLRIPLPPAKSEQTAIATALSDTDALIENLEKLIAKKRNIKQGVMQELLTGRKRLAGFNGEWMKIKLGDICDIRKGQLITEKTAAGGEFPVIAGGINPSYFHNRPNRGKNTITISASGANAGYVSFHRNPIFASDCSTIEEKGTFNIVYIFFLLQLFQKKIFKLQTGGAQPHVYPEHLKPLELVFPQEVTEQDAIANILIDIDEELSGLEKQMNKYQLIKQGMMQTLLTGKIRLV
jgi:type I restriction enzyme S subunit